MSAKSEAKEAAPEKAAPEKGAPDKGAPDKSAPAEKGEAAAAAAPAAAGSSKLGLFAAIGAVVLAPALSIAAANFVLLPKLEKKLGAAPAATAAADAPAADAPAAEAKEAKDGKEGKGGKDGKAAPTYEFSNVVVNLAGTMGTRYLKTSFIVTGAEVGLPAAFEAKKAQLTDVTLSVLSALTLADLEEPGSKNVLREKLVGAYNEVLGRKVVDQVYFSDFVVQ
jgi:flagellar FliL protein